MPVRVRIKNFQSIADADLQISGFVIITGPNNSGKTAVLRAIRGVFTNPPAGPLLRSGACYLSVHLTFDDGTDIIWEKGWEKPFQKGPGVNRYILNGQTLSSVGRKVPPEIEDLGVRSIQAASHCIWPQVASQFTGQLFLVNRPGSAIAEALSDVSRVGQLTAAMRLSESERRTADNELRVRRKDVKALTSEVAKYDGLEGVRALADAAKQGREASAQAAESLETTRSLQRRFKDSAASVQAFSGFDPGVLPPADTPRTIRDLQARIHQYRSLSSRLSRALAEDDLYSSFWVQLPDASRASRIGKGLRRVRGFHSRHQALQREAQVFSDTPMPALPDETASREVGARLYETRRLARFYGRAGSEVSGWESDLSRARTQHQEAVSLVQNLLGKRGLCPTCGTVCQEHPGSL